MKANPLVTLATILMLASLAPRNAAAAEFESIDIHIEYSAADDDGEAMINVKAGLALKELALFAPQQPNKDKRKKIISLTNKHVKGLGLSHIQLETPEPTLEEVLSAYPAGTYTFEGLTTDDEVVTGEVVLAHDILDAPAITAPTADASDVPALGTVVTWDAVPGASAYAVTLEQEDLAIELTADILAGTTSFAFPDGWLSPGLPYVLGVAVKGANGNVVVSEIAFTTAP